jgi:exodeoxyribonuclease VII small subunit
MEIEKKLARLEEIVTGMEKGDITLDASLKLFEEGIRLSRECQQSLTAAEAVVQKLTGFDGNGQPITEPFKPTED